MQSGEPGQKGVFGMTIAERTSEDIKKDVVDQLYWDDRLDASDVKVEVVDRTVRLSGSVPTYTARQAAEKDAWLIGGVTSVDNKLEVVYPSGFRQPEDSDLQADLSTALGWEPELRTADIDVFVRDGWVTLTGSVDAYWKKLRAEELASTLVGVRGVRNELSVVPSNRYGDRMIASSIVSALERNVHVEADEVDVTVEEGVVTLSGSVSSLPAFEAVQDVAAHTTGVLAIRNELTIR